MKTIIISLATLFSLSSFSSEVNLYKINEKKAFIPLNNVEAVISKDGYYSRPQDLIDGFEKLQGVEIKKEKLLLDLSSNINLDEVILNNGLRLPARLFATGGDMGGGGK